MSNVRTPTTLNFPLPALIAAAIDEARSALRQVGGDVDLRFDVAEFDTYWCDHHRGKRCHSIEFTPILSMVTIDKSVYNALVHHHNDRGRIWAHPDMVRRMLTWVSGDDPELPGDSVQSPLSDDEIQALKVTD